MSALPSFDNTLGALFIGFSISTVLYGIFLVQMYTYCRQYPSDKVLYKAVVVLLSLLETAHQAFIGHSVYYYSITNYLNILALYEKPIWSLVFQLLMGAVVGTIVKSLFTLRVWRFSYGNVWLTAFLLILTFGQLALAVVFTMKSYFLVALPDLVNLRVLGIVALGIGVLNDMGIAVALCYYLQTMRTAHTQSDTLIRTLTLYAVNTGVLTSATSFSTLIIFNCMPRNFIFMGCYFVLSKLYAISMVAALNTRQTIRGNCTDGHSKKFSSLEIFDRRRHSTNIPLQTSTTIRGSVDLEHEEEVNASSGIGREFVRQHKPHYTVEW